MKQKQSKMYGSPPQVKHKSSARSGGEVYGSKMQDRNLMAVNPLKEQFAPTDSVPVRQHAQMAGAC